jgi:hypothetical protein
LVLLAGAAFSTASPAGPVDDLQPGQWYEFPNTPLESALPDPVPSGRTRSIISAWSGGTFDTRRNRLMVWGGGHADYSGNEIYAFDVAQGRWLRLTDPSSTPPAQHTYDHLEYLPNQDMLFVAPGGSRYPDGSADSNTYLFDLTNGEWINAGRAPSTSSTFSYFNMTTDYDPVSGRAVVIGREVGGSFDGGSRSWTMSGGGHSALGMSGALDHKRRLFVEVGRSRAYIYEIGSNGAPGARQTLTTTGPQELVGCDAPGFVYDPVADRMVGWCSGQAVYSLNMDTRVWTQHAATNSVDPGDPEAVSYNGTFGRFQYMPAYNAYILVFSTTRNAFAYRLTSGSGTAPAAPTVSLSANPSSVTAGANATLNWTTQNVTSCSATGGWSGSRATSGSLSVGPLNATTSFGLTCTGSSGNASNTVTVQVSSGSTGGGSTGGGSTGGGSTGGGSTGGGSTGGGSTGGGSTGGSTDANTDFQRRASAPGVVRALGFDTQAEWLDHVWDSSSCRPEYAPGCRANAWDQAMKASGAGSVRFDILSNTGQGGGGNLAINFTEDLSVQFGENDEFWLQWRQRFDPYMIEHNYAETSGNGEWKQVIMAQGDRRRADGSVLVANACSENQLVVNNSSGRRYPVSYIECAFYDGFDTLTPTGRSTAQNQRFDANGVHNCTRGSTPVTTGCLFYQPNEWMTFMMHLRMGPQGRANNSASGRVQDGLINSTYEFYVAREGQPFQLAHRQENLVIPRGQHWDAATGIDPDDNGDPGYRGGWDARDAHPLAEYGKIWLTPYHTNKDSAETHERASTWYDELIISTQAIAAPGAAPSGGGTPTPTLQLAAGPTTINSGATSTLSWTATNVASCSASGGWSGTRSLSGSQSVGPLTATTTYTLTCGALSRSVTVIVNPPDAPPVSYSLLYGADGPTGGTALNGRTLGGTGFVYVSPETNVSRVQFFVNGALDDADAQAPFDLNRGGTPYNFDQLPDGQNSLSATITLTNGQSVVASAVFTVADSGAGSGGNRSPARSQVAVPGTRLALDRGTVNSRSPYSDPDGDALDSADWEFAFDNAFSDIVLRRRVNGRTDFSIAAGTLDPAADYWVRTRHRDSRGAESAWSEPLLITTADALPGDDDRNGIEDDSEVPGNFVDTNDNGTNDADEGICNLQSAGDAIGLETDAGEVACFSVVPGSEAPPPPSQEMEFLYGLFNFRVDGLRVDPADPATVTIRVHLPERPAGQVKWFKLDPATGQLFELAATVSFDGNAALIELEDGGPGDFDGVVNGVIVDPSGPVVIPAAVGGGDPPDDVRKAGSSLGSSLLALLAAAALRRRRGSRAGSGLVQQ